MVMITSVIFAQIVRHISVSNRHSCHRGSAYGFRIVFVPCSQYGQHYIRGAARHLLDCVQTSPISFVALGKEEGDVCTQAGHSGEMSGVTP